jgi:type II secretory pathway pseudopilin PulG
LSGKSFYLGPFPIILSRKEKKKSHIVRYCHYFSLLILLLLAWAQQQWKQQASQQQQQQQQQYQSYYNNQQQQQQQSQQQQQQQSRSKATKNKKYDDNEYKWPFDVNDPYSVLGIDHYATDSEVSNAFRKEMLQYHPDTQPNASDAQKRRFIERSKHISNGYRTIKTERKKAQGGRRNK